MSAVEGLAVVQGKLDRLKAAAQRRLEEAAERGGRQMQTDMVALAPRRTGKLRSLLASDEAMRVVRKGGEMRVEVGFRSKRLAKEGFKYFFVETGTKGYVAGQKRSAGYDKRGRKREQRVKRNIPARPAQPFFRPALANLKRNMERWRKEAWAKAAADVLVG